MSSPARYIEAVLFDLDDTLIDWAPVTIHRAEFYGPRVARIHAHLVRLGHELPPIEEFQSILDQAVLSTWSEAKKTWALRSFSDVLRQVLSDLGLPTESIDFDEALRVFGWGPWSGVMPFPDAIPVLQELRYRGYKLGLLTNSFLPMWLRDFELAAYELLDYWDARITAAEVGYMKPHPSIFYAVLDALKVTPERAVFVGDRPRNDIAGANAVGLISVLMAPPHLNRELDGISPDYTITCLSELIPILDSLEGSC